MVIDFYTKKLQKFIKKITKFKKKAYKHFLRGNVQKGHEFEHKILKKEVELKKFKEYFAFIKKKTG